MLRQVLKSFDIDNNVRVTTGDIVDVTGWANLNALEDQHYIVPTDATKATVDPWAKEHISTESSPGKQPAMKLKKSALASRPRVFSRKA